MAPRCVSEIIALGSGGCYGAPIDPSGPGGSLFTAEAVVSGPTCVVPETPKPAPPKRAGGGLDSDNPYNTLYKLASYYVVTIPPVDAYTVLPWVVTAGSTPVPLGGRGKHGLALQGVEGELE